MLSTRAKVIAATILWIGFSVSRLRAQTDPNPLQGSPQQLVTPNQQVVSENAHSLEPGADPENRVGLPLIEHFAQDQQGFWLAPTHLRTKDLRWIMPGVVGLSALFASDHWISQQVPDKPNQLKQSLNVSDYMACAGSYVCFVCADLSRKGALEITSGGRGHLVAARSAGGLWPSKTNRSGQGNRHGDRQSHVGYCYSSNRLEIGYADLAVSPSLRSWHWQLRGHFGGIRLRFGASVPRKLSTCVF